MYVLYHYKTDLENTREGAAADLGDQNGPRRVSVADSNGVH